MTLKRQVLLIFVGYAAVAGGEIVLHWLFAQPYCRVLLELYLARNAAGNSGMYFITDLILPACLLGYWNGRLSRCAASQCAKWFAIPLAAGIVGLYPVYDVLIRRVSFVWWWPRTPAAAVYLFIVNLAFAAGIIVWLTNSYGKTYDPEHRG